MKLLTALLGGLAGTLTTALLHESLKKATPTAPRMEKLDMEALAKILKKADVKVPNEQELLQWTISGEMLSHTLYFGLVGLGHKRYTWLRGTLLGLAAGLTAVTLPKPLGLHGAPTNRTPQTEAMTIALYIIGGLTAASVTKWLQEREDTKRALEYEYEQAMDY